MHPREFACRVSSPTRDVTSVVTNVSRGAYVCSTVHQGTNVTGITCMTTELSPKRLELLKEAVPTASRIVFLSDPEDAPLGLKLTQDAAARLGIKPPTAAFKAVADMPRALDAVAKERPDAVFVYPDPISNRLRAQIAEFALKHRQPRGCSPSRPSLGNTARRLRADRRGRPRRSRRAWSRCPQRETRLRGAA